MGNAPYPHMPIVGGAVPSANQYTFAGGATGLFGQPVYSSGSGIVSLAEANAMGTSIVVGLIGAVSVVPAAFTTLLSAGQVAQQATALWDAIAGTVGGLVAGTTYYLSAAAPGKLTSVAPSTAGQTVEPVLYALSPTTALVLNIPPIQL